MTVAASRSPRAHDRKEYAVVSKDAGYHYAASDMYQALSHFMFRTSQELAQALHSGALHHDLRDIMQELGFASDKIDELTQGLAEDDCSQMSAEDLFHAIRKDYTHLFSNPQFSVMTLYEGRFLGYEQNVKGPQVLLGKTVLSTGKAYEQAGFGAPIAPQERTDHMGVELTFMQVLHKNLAITMEQGNEADRQEIAETIQSFLDDHLGIWGVDFFNAVAEHAEESVYRAIGNVGAAFLEKELQQA